MGKRLPKDIQVLFDKLYKNKEIPSIKRGSRQMRLGYPVLFVYDPKYKKILPYYDTLPLSIILNKYSDGFLGINLHYIPWARRIQLAKQLVRRTKNKNRITYIDIKKAFKSAKLPLALANFALRRYLYSHVRSDMKFFDWETYDLAVKDIKPKFKKRSEQAILKATLEKFKNSKK